MSDSTRADQLSRFGHDSGRAFRGDSVGIHDTTEFSGENETSNDQGIRVLWLFKGLWGYRNEIILAAQLLAKLRKTARESAREYIRKKLRTKLALSAALVASQIALLLLALWVAEISPTLSSRLFGSVVLWLITLYNATELFLVTVPELIALHRTLKGKVGYALKYFLQVSLVTEALRLNVLFLAICLALGVSTRTAIATKFSYTAPWKEWVTGKAASPAPRRRH